MLPVCPPEPEFLATAVLPLRWVAVSLSGSGEESKIQKLSGKRIAAVQPTVVLAAREIHFFNVRFTSLLWPLLYLVLEQDCVQIAKDNTVYFTMILDLNTGDFTYVNAGHNAPLLRRKDGNYEYLQIDSGFVLAGLDRMQYESSQLRFGEGDTLFLYTNGVTEGLGPNEELFGEDRLRDALNDDRGRNLQVSKLLPYIRSAREEFARGAEQADDITILGITCRGPGKEKHENIDGSGWMRPVEYGARLYG